MPEPDLLSSGQEPEPGRSPRRTAVGVLLVLAVLGGGAALRDRPAPPAPRDRPTPVGTVAAVAADPDPVVPAGIDLTTTVSVGHVRSTAVDGDAHAALVERALRSASLGARFVLAPQPGSTASAPKGVEVLFDRVLDEPAAATFVSALEALPATTALVTEEPGTTVDVSAPLLPGSGCEPSGTDAASFAAWFPMFALSSAHGRVVLSYTGPARTPQQLGRTASFLARLCGVPAGDVQMARPERPTG